jgi:hypothetical protein
MTRAFSVAALGAGVALSCAQRPPLDIQSHAPEYSGSTPLQPSDNPRTLAAIGGEPAPTASSGSSAAAPAPAAPVVVPRLPGTPDLTKDGQYSFSGGGVELLVDPRSGQALRLALDGKDSLLAPDAKATPPALPVEAFSAAELEGSSLVLKGSGGASKRFRLDTARRMVEITYTVVNTTSAPLQAGSMDFHRVPSATGLTFFPNAPKLLPGSTLKLNVWQPVCWFAHEQAREPKPLEASVESTEGWVASINDGLLLVKVTSDTAAPVVSIFSAYDPATKLRPWVEVGQRGSFEVAPGKSASASVRLFVRKLPPSLQVKPGNQELVGFVRGVIQ